jgi:hypothetical protein
MNSNDVIGSVFAVINSLFEKKRPQLVAVWVTTSGSDSPFQMLNSAIRKYDSLRGKYIAAYLEVLRLCKKRGEVEGFLRSAYASSRDEPSYFAASAESQGGKPKQAHLEDSLLVKDYRSTPSYFFLTSVKRQANGALASIILHELASKRIIHGSDKATETFKESFSCFRRLKCRVDELVKSRSWKTAHSGGSVAGDAANRSIKDVVEVVTTAYCYTKSASSALQDPNADWSGDSQLTSVLREALKKGSEIFPNLSSTFFSKKQAGPKRKRKIVASTESCDATPPKKSYEVKIPEGLASGSTFVVSVEVDGRSRKVRLTVPEEPAQVMRFTIATKPAHEGSEEKDPEEKTNMNRP